MQYRWIDALGHERSVGTLAELCAAARRGEIDTGMMATVGEGGQWLPAGRHPDVAPIFQLPGGAADTNCQKESSPMDGKPHSMQAPARTSTGVGAGQVGVGNPGRLGSAVLQGSSQIVDYGDPRRAARESVFPIVWKLMAICLAVMSAVDILSYVFIGAMVSFAERQGDPVGFWNAIANIRRYLMIAAGLALMFAVPAAHGFLKDRGYAHFRLQPWVANLCLFVPLAGFVVPWMFWGDVRRESKRFALRGKYPGEVPKYRAFSWAAFALGFGVIAYLVIWNTLAQRIEKATTVATIQEMGYGIIVADFALIAMVVLFFGSTERLWRRGLAASGGPL